MHSSDLSGTDPIGRVHEGMHVVDSSGEDIGRVESVSMGDPQASTTAGNEERGRPGALGAVADAFGGEREPDVPEPLRSRLVREGYIKVDGPNLLDTDRYVPSEYVRDVSEDRVQLSVPKDRLTKED
jgi:Uncharacterized protein conserved in bacteria (DUF2171)